jgi:hypothetical protein
MGAFVGFVKHMGALMLQPCNERYPSLVDDPGSWSIGKVVGEPRLVDRNSHLLSEHLKLWYWMCNELRIGVIACYTQAKYIMSIT